MTSRKAYARIVAMSRNPNHTNRVQEVLYNQGEKAVGTDTANTIPDTEVRRKGFKRVAGRAALAASLTIGALGAGVAADKIHDKMNGPEIPELVEGAPDTEVYTVKPGDTAWGIAREALGEGEEIRGLADNLVGQPDALDGLQPGDKLVVPASPESENQENS